MINPLFRLNERLYKRWFRFQDFVYRLARAVNPLLKLVFSLSALLFIMLMLVQIGFSDRGEFLVGSRVYYTIFYFIFISRYLPEFLMPKKRNRQRWVVDGVLFVGGIVFIALFHRHPAGGAAWLSFHAVNFALVNGYLFLLIIAEMHRVMKALSTLKVSPALLLVGSFLSAIFLGSGLLMLPNSHTGYLSYLDALFTSASAVCVTGLVVVDTSHKFTLMGQIIILLLIQTGGLGIMTFTGFFGYIFTGSASLKDRMLLREVISSESMGNLFRTIVQIMGVTFLIELLGAVILYVSLYHQFDDSFFLAVFHAVSAFCNAGFSSLNNGLANQLLNQNYLFYLTISILIILGGIGFPVLLGLLRCCHSLMPWSKLSERRKRYNWRIFVNQSGVKIVLVCTFALLLAGTVFYYLFERQGSMLGQSTSQQLVVSFFGSVSARTAGFNVTDISLWSSPTVFVMMVLMWIGASPGSTGGGIKTITFAIAVKAVWDFIRGRQQVELYQRELGVETLLRVLVVIVLSLTAIFAAFLVLLLSDKQLNPVYLLFECFSAFGTVGLSIVNTASLSETGKITIMVLMFLGRLGPVTVLAGFMIDSRARHFRYPRHDYSIN